VRRGVWLVPPEDVAALAPTIIQIQQIPSGAARLAQSLRRYVMNHLTWKAVAADILAVMGKSWKQPTAK
jgi:glycosyltransferase involved in cell wall biosynthesis